MRFSHHPLGHFALWNVKCECEFEVLSTRHSFGCTDLLLFLLLRLRQVAYYIMYKMNTSSQVFALQIFSSCWTPFLNVLETWHIKCKIKINSINVQWSEGVQWSGCVYMTCVCLLTFSYRRCIYVWKLFENRRAFDVRCIIIRLNLNQTTFFKDWLDIVWCNGIARILIFIWCMFLSIQIIVFLIHHVNTVNKCYTSLLCSHLIHFINRKRCWFLYTMKILW